jgi:hypothetical protein
VGEGRRGARAVMKWAGEEGGRGAVGLYRCGRETSLLLCHLSTYAAQAGRLVYYYMPPLDFFLFYLD